MNTKKKCVLITGASRGIGRACALRFAKDGYHVFINSGKSIEQLNQLKEELTILGTECTVVPGDVGCSKDVQSIFQKLNTHPADWMSLSTTLELLISDF